VHFLWFLRVYEPGGCPAARCVLWTGFSERRAHPSQVEEQNIVSVRRCLLTAQMPVVKPVRTHKLTDKKNH
jgi:hypothetical protein